MSREFDYTVIIKIGVNGESKLDIYEQISSIIKEVEKYPNSIVCRREGELL